MGNTGNFGAGYMGAWHPIQSQVWGGVWTLIREDLLMEISN